MQPPRIIKLNGHQYILATAAALKYVPPYDPRTDPTLDLERRQKGSRGAGLTIYFNRVEEGRKHPPRPFTFQLKHWQEIINQEDKIKQKIQAAKKDQSLLNRHGELPIQFTFSHYPTYFPIANWEELLDALPEVKRTLGW